MNTILLDVTRVTMLRAMLKPILTPELWPVVELMLEPVPALVTFTNDGWVNGHPDAAHTAKLVRPVVPAEAGKNRKRRQNYWTAAEDNMLLARYSKREDAVTIGAAIGRSMASVYMRVMVLRKAGRIGTYQRPDLAALAKLPRSTPRAEQKVTNHSMPYTASEDEFIAERYMKCMAYADIAAALHRLPKAIISRVHVLRKAGKITSYRDERSANQAEIVKKWYADKASGVTT